MKKAVMYGAGNIGRGFVGALLSQSGYEVTFIDVNAAVVDGLNARHSYPLRIIDGDGFEDISVSNVLAIDGRDAEKASAAIAAADIMATAVGANILKAIAPVIASGLKLRFEASGAPLDILICENLMDADKALAGLIKEHLSAEDRAAFDEKAGMVETSIGRMVPVQTLEMQDGDFLRVCVERYDYLPVDKAAFKGALPDIRNLVPYTPFGYYLKRKLYLHNLGHCVCAYIGLYSGKTYIWEAVDDPNILMIAKNAMLESMAGLGAAYGIRAADILPHIDDLLRRFTNKALGDTCARVGADTRRKLAPGDRLIGASRFCEENGVNPVYILAGAAAALHRHIGESGMEQGDTAARGVIAEICGLGEGDAAAAKILEFYRLLRAGAKPEALRKAAERMQALTAHGIV